MSTLGSIPTPDPGMTFLEACFVFASGPQGGQKNMGMRFQSTWPSCLPAGSGFLPSCAAMEAGPSALAIAEVGRLREGPQGRSKSWTKRAFLPSVESSCQYGFLSCLPKIPITFNCLPCVALAAIFFPLWCLPCQIFKGSYHVSSAKLYTSKVFSSLLINLGLPAPQHLPLRAVCCLLWIRSWKHKNFSP